jgi:flagellar hook-length control protein FliK
LQLATQFQEQTVNIQSLSTQLGMTSTAQGSVGQSYKSESRGSSFLDMLKSIDQSTTAATDGVVSTSTSLKKEEPAEPQKSTVEKKSDEHGEENSVKEKKVDTKKNDEKPKTEPSSDKSAQNAQNVTQHVGNAAAKDFSTKVQGKSQNKISSVKAKTATNTINESQLAFLKTRDSSNDPESIIANATQYTQKKSKNDLLANAQNLVVDDPKNFLNIAEVSGENQNASVLSKMTLKKAIGGAQENKNDTDTTATAKKIVKQTKQNVFTIIDERGQTTKDEAVKATKSKNNLSITGQNNNSVDMTMTLANNANQNILSANNQTASSVGSNFQSMLSEQIQQNAPEFVKAGNIVLRDNSNGTINMVLKPESLGNVKISLELSDKVITGQITVSSQEAYDAFKENINTLKQAFQQSGFEDAQFNLSFANNGSNAETNQGQQQSGNEWMANRAYKDYVYAEESNVQPSAAPEYKMDSSYSINVVA